jgi:hypothetical protein
MCCGERIPAAFARKATASPLNVVVVCAELATGIRAKPAVKQTAIGEFFFVIICTPLFRLKVPVARLLPGV